MPWQSASTKSLGIKILKHELKYNIIQHMRLAAPLLALTTVLGLFPSIIFGVLNPVYIDEIGMLIVQGRFLADGHKLISLNPSCVEAFATVPPISWHPISYLRSWLASMVTMPHHTRLIGLVSYLCTITILTAGLAKVFRLTFNSWQVWLLIPSTMSLGVLTPMMLLYRPEQTLLLVSSILALAPLLFKCPANRRGRAMLFGFIALFLWIWLLSSHPKSLLLMPLSLLSAWRLLYRNFPICFFVSCAIVYLGIEAYAYYLSRFNCPEDPFLTGQWAEWTLSLSSLSSDIYSFLRQALRNLGTSLLYFKQIALTDSPPFGWLPDADVPSLALLVDGVILVLFSACFAGTLVSLRSIILASKSFWNVRYRQLMGFTILISIILFSCFQTQKYFYESGFIVPMFLLGSILSIQEDYLVKFRLAANFLIKIVAVAGLLNAYCIIKMYLAPISEYVSRNRVPPSQTFSIRGYLTENELLQLNQLGTQCAIHNNSDVVHLVLDELTYIPYSRTKEPFQIQYLTGFWGQGIQGVQEFLRKRNSAGLITHCSQIPAELSDGVKRLGEFCCLGAF